jgi:hypothetical protein
MTALALPPGTDSNAVDEWQIDKAGEYPTYRCIWSTPLSTDTRYHLKVVGVQLADGSICTEPGDAPAVYLDQDLMTPDTARAMATALNAAADLAEQWSEVTR